MPWQAATSQKPRTYGTSQACASKIRASPTRARRKSQATTRKNCAKQRRYLTVRLDHAGLANSVCHVVDKSPFFYRTHNGIKALREAALAIRSHLVSDRCADHRNSYLDFNLFLCSGRFVGKFYRIKFVIHESCK